MTSSWSVMISATGSDHQFGRSTVRTCREKVTGREGNLQPDRACHPGGHSLHYYPGALSPSQVNATGSIEELARVDVILMSCRDFTTWLRTRKVAPVVAARGHAASKGPRYLMKYRGTFWKMASGQRNVSQIIDFRRTFEQNMCWLSAPSLLMMAIRTSAGKVLTTLGSMEQISVKFWTCHLQNLGNFYSDTHVLYKETCSLYIKNS